MAELVDLQDIVKCNVLRSWPSLLYLHSRFFTVSAYNFGPRRIDALPVPMKPIGDG